MDKRCTVCNHSRRHDINLALLGGATLDALKKQFGLSRSALHRHKMHLQCSLDQAEDRMRNNFLMSYLFRLNDYHAAAAATVTVARAEGNARLTLQAANAGTRIINSMARFTVDLDRETIYRLMTSPMYPQSGCLLPDDPRILAGVRQTLVRRLQDACPEPGDLFDPEDVAACSKSARESHEARQLEFSDFLLPLADILPSAASGSLSPAAPDSRSTVGAPQPEEMRDVSGTDAGQTSPFSKIIEEIQSDMQDEQKSGIHLAAGPTLDPLPSALCPPPTASCWTDPAPGLEQAALAAASAPELDPEQTSPLADLPDADSAARSEEAGASSESLPDAQAAQLEEYLANFAPYAKQHPARQPDPSAPPPAAADNHAKPPPPQFRPRQDRPNFGNPGLAREIIGTFC